MDLERYDNENISSNVISGLELKWYLFNLKTKMMQEYGTNAKLLSDFGTLNQVFDGFIMLCEIMNPFFFGFYILLCCYLMVDKCSVFWSLLGGMGEG